MRTAWIIILAALCLAVPAPVRASGDALLRKGVTLLNEGRTEAAIAALHQAEERLPDRARAAPLLGEAYLRLGMQRMNGGADESAREAFAEAGRYLPDDPRPYQGMALSWLHVGQPAAALGELNEAVAIAGDTADLLLLLGRAHYAAGDLAQAEDAWQRAVDAGAGPEVTPLLDKVRRERQAERHMRRDLAGRFTIGYAPGVSEALAARILEVLQEAYADLGADLGYYPDTEIPVLLYAREDFRAVTGSPQWAGAVYDGKIRVPLGGVSGMTPPLEALLHHEYAHVVVRFLGRGRAPVWLNEGIAEAAGRRRAGADHMPLPSGSLPDAAALERPFSELPDDLVPLAYQQSYARVSRLIELCGWLPLGELLQRLGRGESWEQAVAAAYAPYGYDWPRLQVELREKLH